MKKKKIILDMKTRWNSTDLILKSVKSHTEAIQTFLNQYFSYENVFDEQFQVAFGVMTSLKTFNDETNILSRIYYPTVNLVLQKIFHIFVLFRNYK